MKKFLVLVLGILLSGTCVIQATTIDEEFDRVQGSVTLIIPQRSSRQPKSTLRTIYQGRKPTFLRAFKRQNNGEITRTIKVNGYMKSIQNNINKVTMDLIERGSTRNGNVNFFSLFLPKISVNNNINLTLRGNALLRSQMSNINLYFGRDCLGSQAPTANAVAAAKDLGPIDDPSCHVPLSISNMVIRGDLQEVNVRGSFRTTTTQSRTLGTGQGRFRLRLTN